MKVNGTDVKVEPPYETNGVTMVPLSVITKAFGAKLALKDNKVITLTYGKHVIVLTIGSKSATINGKKIALQAAPVIRNGVTMVPLRVIVEAFGAKIQVDKATKTITITGKLVSSTAAGTTIDSDAGKTKIGDSHYQWSMKYPAGLVQQTGYGVSDKRIIFTDVKDEYYLGIYISVAEERLSAEERLEWLWSSVYYDEMVLDVQSFPDAYHRIVTKDTDGFYYEYRGYQANGYYYTLVFGKSAKSAKALEEHANLLDSFRTSFNKSDDTIKDLSQNKTGSTVFKNEDYGLSVELPNDWKGGETGSVNYYGPNMSNLYMEVYSLQRGDTLDGWVERQIAYYRAIFAKAYVQELEVSDTVWSGVAAKQIKLTHSIDKKNWYSTYQVFAVKGGYKYFTEFVHPDDSGEAALTADKALKSMKVDFSRVESLLGNVPDLFDSLNLEALTTKTSKKYGYSITVPKHWVSGPLDMERATVVVDSFVANLSVYIEKGSLDEGYEELLERLLNNIDLAKQESKTDTIYAGVPAVKFEFSSSAALSGTPTRMTLYLLESKGYIYVVQGVLPEAYASDLNVRQLDAALASFALTP